MQAILRPKYLLITIIKYFGMMMACIGRNLSPSFKLMKNEIVVFDEVYILFHFNIYGKIYILMKRHDSAETAM